MIPIPSGAGYAVSIEASIRALLAKTRQLLDNCTCGSACHKCLKHYRNQHIHSVLDRKSALDLLDWGETGTRAPALSNGEQTSLLRSLEQILQRSSVRLDLSGGPVWAEARHVRKKIGIYPAM